jgi:hypothetical protein
MSGAIDANAKPLPVGLKSGARRIALVLACPARSILRRNRFVFREVARPWRLQTLRTRLSPRLGASRSIDGKIPVRSSDVDRHDADQHVLMARFAASSAAAGHCRSATPVRIATLTTARKAPFQNIGARRGELHAPPAASPLQTQPSIAAVVRRSSRRLRSKTYGRRPWRESKSSSDISPTENPLNIPQLQCCDCCWFRPGSQSQATLSALSLDGCWARCSRISMCARDRSNDVSRTCR